jgi:hypothetical protein
VDHQGVHFRRRNAATNQRWIEIGNDTSLAQNLQKEAE